MRDRDWSADAYMAEFDSAGELSAAVRALHDQAYTMIETYSPVPVDTAVRYRRSRLPVIVFLGGVLGGVTSYAVQWFANVYSYPLNLGGRPPHAVPAFLIATFEGAVLCASLAAFVGFFVITRLPQPWHPLFELDGFEHATVDRYWIAVDARDGPAAPGRTVEALRRLSPLRVVRLEAQL